jgi:hypothetical protein
MIESKLENKPYEKAPKYNCFGAFCVDKTTKVIYCNT